MLEVLRQKEPELPASLGQAWTVRFQEASGAVDPHAFVVRQPRNLSATLEPVDLDATLAGQTPDAADNLTVVWMPPGTKATASIERDAEIWARNDEIAPVRAGIRTVRVFWTRHRALLYCSAEHLSAALDAVIRFTVAQREALAVEETMQEMWTTMEADAPLTHAVTPRHQASQKHVNAMTLSATRMRAQYLRLAQTLEQLDPRLDETSKRIFAELILAASLYDRLELLEAPIQFALDQYEIANSRLIEEKNATKDRRDYVILFVFEALIILLLLYPLRLYW